MRDNLEKTRKIVSLVIDRKCIKIVRVMVKTLGITDMPLVHSLTYYNLIEFGMSGKSPYLTLVRWKGCFLRAQRVTRLYRRTLTRQSYVSRIQGVPR
jgi:hypothetical protein